MLWNDDANYHASPGGFILLPNALVFRHQHGNKTAEIRGAIAPGFHTTGITFRTKSVWSNNLQNRMFIAPNGNVGIGTTSPSQKLTVHGNIMLWNDDANYHASPGGFILLPNALVFRHQHGNKTAEIRGAIAPGFHTTGITFRTKSVWSNNLQNRMFIAPNGNVGIGTTSPSQKLTVHGNIMLWNDDANYHASPGGFILLPNALVFRHQHGNKTAEIRGAIAPGFHTTGITFRTKSVWSNNLQNRMFIAPNGNVGIGTTSPSQKLTVHGNIMLWNDDANYHASPGGFILLPNALVFRHQHGNKTAEIRGAIAPGFHTTGITFRTKSVWSNNLQNRMFIAPNGNVGIGTTSPSAKLNVNGNTIVRGTVSAKKFRTSSTGADFVFEPSYKLPSLEDVARYVKTNKHLPDVPAAKTMQEKGIDLGEMNTKLLQKVEELTLYLIEQNQKIRVLEQKVKTLEQR